MSYTNRIFAWDFDALKRFYEKYIVKWLNSAVSWTEAQKKQARANLGFGDGDIDSVPTAGSDNLATSGGIWLSNIKNLFAPDSDFSNPLNCILSYTIKPGLNMTKDYYIKHCGIRDSDYTNVLIRIVDKNSEIISNTHFDGSDLGLHVIDAGYFVFTIDVSKIKNNSSSTYTEYHYHLYKNSANIDSVPTAGSDNLATSGGIWLSNIKNLFAPDSDFSNPLNCVLSYTIKPGLNMTKDYYIKHCSIRYSDYTNVLFRIVDKNGEIIYDTHFDGSDLGLHVIDAGYFVFTIDVSKIKNNSSSTYTEYHYHLYKNSYAANPASEYLEPILSSNMTTSASRLSKQLSLNDYKGQSIVVSISSPIDEDTFVIYGCNDDGSFNASIILTPYIDSGNYSTPFNVPENGYIWLFTRKTEVGIEKIYNVTIGSEKYLPPIITEIENIKQQIKPFTGKTIVCFGDSITESEGVDGKRYSDYLADISDATVINVGIGGTRLQQRTVPTTDPKNVSQAKAALDIVNMVKASCEQDFTLQIAAAQYVSDYPQYVNIVARLQSIDWSTVSAVTILGGTNDWTGSVLENIGTHGSTDPNTTLGAINYMLQMLSYTYPQIPVYFFTPLMRYKDQDFEGAFTTSKAFTTGQHTLYEHKLYAFISDHSAGDWNPNEVRRLTAQEMYNISSDVIVEDVGMNLKAFSQLIADEVKYNHIPICDMYNEMWNAYNYTEALTSDLTHPRNGDAIIAQKIFSFINANRKFN